MYLEVLSAIFLTPLRHLYRKRPCPRRQIFSASPDTVSGMAGPARADGALPQQPPASERFPVPEASSPPDPVVKYTSAHRSEVSHPAESESERPAFGAHSEKPHAAPDTPVSYFCSYAAPPEICPLTLPPSLLDMTKHIFPHRP